MAGNGPGGPGQVPAAGAAAKETAPKFGGLRGGKKREDGLVPGSAEAAQADRKKDRDRKKRERDARQEPPPLPSASQTMDGPSSTTTGGLGTLPGTPVAPVVPWDASTLQPAVEIFLPAAEELMVNQIASRAAKARLPGDIVKEIEAEAKWSASAKKGLEVSTAQVAAKWLNKAGISAEYQPEVTFLTALGRVLGGHALLLRRLDKLIALANVQPAKPAKPEEEKKP
jgi:hypothetical protein